jgi:hypothetical protein
MNGMRKKPYLKNYGVNATNLASSVQYVALLGQPNLSVLTSPAASNRKNLMLFTNLFSSTKSAAPAPAVSCGLSVVDLASVCHQSSWQEVTISKTKLSNNVSLVKKSSVWLSPNLTPVPTLPICKLPLNSLKMVNITL